ncbi:MAG: mandelate racemase [Geminicoccaceae bacterium]|nr:mandelate racemase [Geminicoccaceae bacterium]
MSAPRLRVTGSRLRIRNLFTRLPFRFGSVTMEAAPLALLEVDVAFEDGGTQRGVAGDFLSIKWFDKRPEKSPAENVADLLQALRHARAVYSEAGAGTPFGSWDATYDEIERRVSADGFVRLGASFAASMLERAVIDATGRHLGQSFDAMVRTNALGIVPQKVHADLGQGDLERALPERPSARVAVRHTVGLVDPLAAGEADAAPDDGLPVTLAQYLTRDGLRWLKIKVSGDVEADRARLERIAAVIASHGRPVRCTLDGNEQFSSVEQLASFFEAVRTAPELHSLWRSVAFIEQPLHRDTAMARPLDAAERRAIGRPLLIDESDDRPTAFREAIELGYRGVSHKNCKGVYKSLLNAALAARHDRADDRHFLSAEDLTNLPMVPLQADLAVVATLGIEHAERNGHHYFHGLDHLTDGERRRALGHHPELYGEAGLRIRDGMLEIGSLQVPGLGVVDRPDEVAGVAEEDWRFEMLEKDS